MQRSIPCLFMRGGTSRGPFFHAHDLPADFAARDALLLAIMGSPDARQIDGLGGADPLTSKVGIVSRGTASGRGSGVSVRAGVDHRSARGHHSELRQHAGRRSAFCPRDRAFVGTRRNDDCAGAHTKYRHVERYRSVHAQRTSRVFRRRAYRRCARHGPPRSISAFWKRPVLFAAACCRRGTWSIVSTAST